MSERLFRACLRLYPSLFRREFAAAMAETFSCHVRDLGSRPLALLRFVIQECASAAIWGITLRIAYFFGLGGRGKVGSGAGTSRLGALPPTRPTLKERGRDLLSDTTRDLRHAARTMARRPGVTTGAVLALGLGIGLSTTIFYVIYGAVFRPLPFEGGERIMHLEQEDPPNGRRKLRVGYHDYLDWRAQQTVFDDLAAFTTGTVNLSDDAARPERYFGGFLSANAWDVLGVQPVLGRGFTDGDDRPGAPPVAIIAHSVWDSRFGQDPDVVGNTVRVNGTPTTVVGVMPEGIAFPYWEDVWLPLKVDPLATPRGGGPGLEVFGKLRDGVTLEEARTELEGISARLAAEYPETNEGLVAFVEPYIDSYHGEDGFLAATFLLGFGLSVLLIACFNVANLLLAQAVTQVRDVAVRVSMGASRGRILSRILQQALLLASSGAVLGVAITVAWMWALNRWITATATFPLPFWMDMKVDGPGLLFVLTTVGISALASGLLPGLRASRMDVHATLTDASRGNSSLRIGRVSRFMVLSQISITAVLLIIGGHMALQVADSRRTDHGYPTTDVFTARIGLFQGVFPDREDRLEFFRELVRRLEEKPGVMAASLTTTLPGTESGITRLAFPDEIYPGTADMPTPRIAYVSPGFFGAFETPVLEGREFEATDDDEGPPVALVNRLFAERFFQGEDPVGRQIRLGWPEPQGEWRTIVGVVTDMDLDGAMDPEGDPEAVYLPIAQADVSFVSVALRTRGDPMALAPTVRNEVMALQGDTPIYFVRTLHQAIYTNLLDVVLVGSLVWALALAAFLLASVGLYGVTSFLASQRTRELGVRIALGAKGGDVARLVVRQGMTQVLLGLALGLGTARGLMILFDRSGMDTIPPSNTLTVSVCLVLGLTGLAAVYAPAWRATKVDPGEAVRAEEKELNPRGPWANQGRGSASASSVGNSCRHPRAVHAACGSSGRCGGPCHSWDHQ